jgi:hypothetical protein
MSIAIAIPVNYVFLRHSNSNGNSLQSMITNRVISPQEADFLIDNVLIDPELSQMGKFASTQNGNVITKTLKENNIKMINVVGCSCLLRSMLSAYYLTRKWEKSPEKIFVFPYLREIDENSNDKWSDKSRIEIDTNGSYCMKTLIQQKHILEKMGLLHYFDFTFIESSENLRHSVGDIDNFIIWTNQNILNDIYKKSNPPAFYNFFIITHAGVLSDYTKTSFSNNTGFILKYIYSTRFKHLTKTKFINLRDTLEKDKYFISNYNGKRSVNMNAPEFKKILKTNLLY